MMSSPKKNNFSNFIYFLLDQSSTNEGKVASCLLFNFKITIFSKFYYYIHLNLYINKVVISVCMYVRMYVWSHHHDKTARPICPKFCTEIHLGPEMVFAFFFNYF